MLLPGRLVSPPIGEGRGTIRPTAVHALNADRLPTAGLAVDQDRIVKTTCERRNLYAHH
jgi:hypothetical protein